MSVFCAGYTSTTGLPCKNPTAETYCRFHHPMSRRCQGLEDDGTRCKVYRIDRDWCRAHDPESVAALMAKGRRA